MINLIKKAAGGILRGYGLDGPSLLKPRATWATVCAPDDIITAQILEKVAKSPSDYKFTTGFHSSHKDWKYGGYYYPHDADGALVKGVAKLAGPELIVLFGAARAPAENGYHQIYFDKTCRVNDILLGEKASIRLLSALETWHEGIEEANRVAAKAKADMEANEKKWELAEKLSGMVRNEQGALIPKPSEEIE